MFCLRPAGSTYLVSVTYVNSSKCQTEASSVTSVNWNIFVTFPNISDNICVAFNMILDILYSHIFPAFNPMKSFYKIDKTKRLSTSRSPFIFTWSAFHQLYQPYSTWSAFSSINKYCDIVWSVLFVSEYYPCEYFIAFTYETKLASKSVLVSY